MSFWKKIPYWLKGGAVGAIIGLLLLFYGNYCSETKISQYPENEYASLKCPWLIIEGPGLLLLVIIQQTPGINNIFGSFENSLVFEKILTVTGWILIGIVVGFFYDYKKSRNKKELPSKRKPL